MHRILIVEDEARLAAFIDKGLKKNGFSTAIANDGEQALLMAESDEYDLILLDLGLPIKDGWTVLKELRTREKQIPVIVVSALEESWSRRIDSLENVNDYVTKPFSFRDLLKRVHRLLTGDYA